MCECLLSRSGEVKMMHFLEQELTRPNKDYEKEKKMAKIIAIANQKGGAAKTTTTFNFGSCLADKGYKVLIVDFDSQGNLTQYYGATDCDNMEHNIATGIKQLINDEEPVRTVIKDRENLHLVPSNILLASVMVEMILATGREYLLKRYLQPLKDEYDYILIDCAPSLNIDLVNALTAADEVMIVSNPDTFSALGVQLFISSIQKTKRNLNPNLKIAGLLCTRVDRTTNFAKDTIKSMRTVWGKYMNIFETEIPASVRVQESQSVSRPMQEYEKSNPAAQAYIAFTDEYLNQ